MKNVTFFSKTSVIITREDVFDIRLIVKKEIIFLKFIESYITIVC